MEVGTSLAWRSSQQPVVAAPSNILGYGWPEWSMDLFTLGET